MRAGQYAAQALSTAPYNYPYTCYNVICRRGEIVFDLSLSLSLSLPCKSEAIKHVLKLPNIPDRRYVQFVGIMYVT